MTRRVLPALAFICAAKACGCIAGTRMRPN
jgi:hypothetical protein